MSVKAAVHSYTNDNLNCAQSVLKAFRHRKDFTESEIDAARALGGGRAAGGVCGALHAALLFHDGEEEKRSMRENFSARAGSEQCREIRAKKMLTCVQCVELAAELLEAGCTLT